ncbi:MAG: hypothetical protein FWD26_11355 [Treponema sp.]|nr:hypothetical protein [Treponema sp.]
MNKKNNSRLRVLHGIIIINTIFVVLSGSIILVSMWVSSERNVRVLVDELKEELQNAVYAETFRFFNQTMIENQSITHLLYRNFSDPINNDIERERLLSYYREKMRFHPWFKKIFYSDTEGNIVILFRMQDGSFSRRFVTNNGKEIFIRWEHECVTSYGSFPNSIESAQAGFDPRRQIWYEMAQKERGIIWAPVALLTTDNLPGLTNSIPLFDRFGRLTGVSSIDIAVDELSRFLGTLSPTPNTEIYITDQQNHIIALQVRHDRDMEKLFVRSTDEHGNTEVNFATISTLPDKNSRYLLENILKNNEQYNSIKLKNEMYMTTRFPITITGGLDLVVCIITPENDLMGDIRKNLRNVTIFSIIIIIIIPVVSTFFSQTIAKPMRILAAEMSKIKTLELDSQVKIETNFSEILDMRESFESMRKGLINFKRYVPADLVDQLINESISADIGGEMKELTIFFSDIAKFTSIAEKTEPQQLVLDLHTYFGIVSKTILENKGTIDKYIGDAVMAFWGAPSLMEDHADKACNAAINVRNNLHTLSRQWGNQGKMPFHTRIGIHTGNVVVGNMGCDSRLNYTVIGDAVNVSSRLEGINKVYGTEIIVSENTFEQCSDRYEFRLLDRVSLLGRYEGMNVYELITFKDDLNKTSKNIYKCYEAGLQHYHNRNWKEGIKYFSIVLKYRPFDAPSKLMRERCMKYLKNPPPEDWNGVYLQDTK